LQEGREDIIESEKLKNTIQFARYGQRAISLTHCISEPDGGGSIYFHDLKMTVPAVKGRTVFWYNIDKDGNKIEGLKHSCDAVVGKKVVLSCFIREKRNNF